MRFVCTSTTATLSPSETPVLTGHDYTVDYRYVLKAYDACTDMGQL